MSNANRESSIRLVRDRTSLLIRCKLPGFISLESPEIQECKLQPLIDAAHRSFVAWARTAEEPLVVYLWSSMYDFVRDQFRSHEIS